MPLLNLKTNLKSLKYGNDQPGGGSSGQPYVTTDINNPSQLPVNDDGFIRGGTIRSTNASLLDAFRIGRFLKDLPKGPLFIAKQIGLQLSNPRLEVKPGTSEIFQPTRIYNLGINTLAQVPVNAFGVHFNRHGLLPIQDNQTKYLSIVLSNNQGSGDNNRLVKLKNKLIGTNEVVNIDSYISGPSSVYGIGKTFIRRRGDFLIINQDVTENEWAIKGAKEAGISYRLIGHEGGVRDGYTDASRRITNFTALSNTTGSILAPSFLFFNDKRSIQSVFVGRRYNTPLGLNEYDKLSQYSGSNTWFPQNGEPRKANLQKDLGVSNQYFSGSTIDIIEPGVTYGRTNTPKEKIKINSNDTGSIRKVSIIPVQVSTIPKSTSYQVYQKLIESKNLKEKKYTDGLNDINTFGIYGNNLPDAIVGKSSNNILPDSTQSPVYYSNNNDKLLVTLKSWKEINREKRIGSGIQDSINLTPIFDEKAGTLDIDEIKIGGKSHNINDLVKFRIQSLNGDNPTQANWMIFRAYLTQFSDSTDATWNPVKYIGRGEDFYIYNGFSRKIQIGFKVAALSAEEMRPMYQKLNYLMGNLMPDYKNGLLMRGPLVKMTIGNWLDGQDGILNSLSYTVPNDSPWEIALNGVNFDKLLVLPHIIEVSLGFTPIGSQTNGINKISEKSQFTSHIAQNFNNYQYIG
jgi:hypothetical protein